MKSAVRHLSLTALLMLVMSCSLSPRHVPGSDTSGMTLPAAAPGSGPGAPVLRIVPEASVIRVRVYRDGPLAGFGHNHVISWKPSGWVSQSATLAGSAFDIEVPLDRAEVDDPGQRAQEGADFAEVVSADARAGTRRNLLGEQVLDVAHHARMSIRCVAIDESGPLPVARVLISIAGHETSRSVPFAVERSRGEVHASGELSLRQSELGLAPYSLLLGALKVRDEIEVKFSLVARLT